MKKSIKILLFIVFISSLQITSCSKDSKVETPKVFGCMDPASDNYNPLATADNGTCQYSGNVTFWYNSGGTSATVIVGGKTGYITSYYSTYSPSCGATGCASFTLPVGSYTYVATSSWHTWTGNITITKKGCLLMLLQG